MTAAKENEDFAALVMHSAALSYMPASLYTLEAFL
jgi:hypothetical protein